LDNSGAEPLSKRGKKLRQEIRAFIQQYGRKSDPHHDPNDRRYDRDIERMIQRMKPEELDAIMNDGDEGVE
jgi:predicted metal-dependent hydrolase